jgi:hypothetical protein
MPFLPQNRPSLEPHTQALRHFAFSIFTLQMPFLPQNRPSPEPHTQALRHFAFSIFTLQMLFLPQNRPSPEPHTQALWHFAFRGSKTYPKSVFVDSSGISAQIRASLFQSLTSHISTFSSPPTHPPPPLSQGLAGGGGVKPHANSSSPSEKKPLIWHGNPVLPIN